MKPFHILLSLCIFSFALVGGSVAQVNVTTWQTNLQHTGNNASETALTPAAISSPGNFGLLFSQKLDGQTYGQPLLVSGVKVDNVTHNVVYVATERCNLYAFDADNDTGANATALKQISLLPAGTVPVPQSVVGSADIPDTLGITTTPVIDTATSTIYIVSKVQRTADTTYHQYLYALDLGTLTPKFNGPVEIATDFPGYSANGKTAMTIPFSALHEHMRCAMALYNGVVYLSFASHSDTNPYHGEILGYDATTLQLVKQFIATPNGSTSEGGIWMAGASPAVDSAGNMYVAVGNGTFNSTTAAGSDWGESMLKLPTTGTFNVSSANTLNWFTPNIYTTLNNGDLDLGSGGLTLLPDQAGPHQHILVGGGKGAVLYVVDRDNMGGVNTPDAAIQEIPEVKGDWIFTTPSYYNGYIYYSPAGGPLEQRAVGYNPADGTYISTTPITSNETYPVKGSGCFISSNGTTNGIVWILSGAGIRAYNATNVTGSAIYTASATIPSGNVACSTTKFSLPMVANGKVYYTAYENASVTTGHLLVYGILPAAVGTPTAPSNATATANSSGVVTVKWTSNSTNESGFKVKRATSATGTYTTITTEGAGVTSYVDDGTAHAGLAAGTTYYYQIVATNANGDSNPTNVASATTFPYYSENGLVAYWGMDELGGTKVYDATGRGHLGTVNSEAGLTTAGYINSGVALHGTGQAGSNVTVANAADLQFTAGQSFTLSAWVLPGALRNSEETILAKSRDAGNYYGVWINAANQWVFRGPGGDVVGSTAVGSAWAHVTAVQDGAAGTRTLYVNGVKVGQGAAQAADGGGALWMGQQNVTGTLESFPGTIDEVRVYNRALPAGEITNLMGPPALAAVSSQTHGTSGVFGVMIWPYAAKKIEPRKGATTGRYNLVLSFSAPVSGLSASLKTLAGGAAVGSVSGITYDTTGKVATVALTGVGNSQALDLHLASIAPGNGTADIPFSVLWGDVNGDNIVNPLDASIVQHMHTTLVSGASVADDLNCDGMVNATDDTLASAANATSLGAQTDTNLAVFQPSMALSNTVANLPANAFDASITTRWESVKQVDPQWIYVDLGATRTIHSVLLYWESAGGKDYTIDVSDDTNTWTPMVTVTGNTIVNKYLTYSGLNSTGRYVRMNGTARTSGTGAVGFGYSLYDFQVIGLSSTGNSVSAPTVNSATTASALTGGAFSYQITATNNPASYNATGLPAGLSVNTGTGLISGTPTQTGVSTVTISAKNAGGTGTATLTLTVQAPQAPYVAWQSLYFTESDLANPAVSGATATPAGDGITNLMKYALNLDPKKNGTAGLPTQSVTAVDGQNYLTLTYTKVLSATDITYVTEVTGDMQTWSSGAASTATSATNNSDGKTATVVVRDLTPMSNASERFVRLKVTSP